jgi:hypothetical protein
MVRGPNRGLTFPTRLRLVGDPVKKKKEESINNSLKYFSPNPIITKKPGKQHPIGKRRVFDFGLMVRGLS